MEGRPYLRFVYVENAIGNRTLLTTPEGNIIEALNPLLPTGRLGQLAFVSEDDTDKYETDYIVRLATVAQNVSELGDSRSNAKPTRPIYDIANDRVYVSDRTTSGGDILFLVDVSGSMSPDIAKLKASIAGLFTKLDGDGVDDLRVGLGAYMVNHKQLMVGSSPWANYSSAAISMFSNLATNIVSGSSNAQAASAIKWGVETYKFRDDTKKFIVLVTDTGREGDPLTPPDVQSLLVSNDITLIVIAKDQSYYAPTAWATGGEFIDSSSANNWDDLLAGTLGNIITGGIIDPSVPPVWTLQRHPEDSSQYLLPSQAAGIGRLVYDEYHKTLWYVQPNGILLLIAKQQEMPDVNKQTIKARAATAIESGQPEVYTGADSSSNQSLTIEAVSVVRDTRQFSANTSALTTVCNLSDIMTDIFQDQDWASSPYMLKQVMTIANKSAVSTLQFNLLQDGGGGAGSVMDTVPVNGSITPPLVNTDWTLQCQGEYQVDLLVEVISGRLQPQILDEKPSSPDGPEVYEYTDPSDGSKKYVVLGQIKKFTITVDPATDSTGQLFDYQGWISNTIASRDYMILGGVTLSNTSMADSVQIQILNQTDQILHTFDIGPGLSTMIELHREDIKLQTDTPGGVEATIDLQVTAYRFKES